MSCERGFLERDRGERGGGEGYNWGSEGVLYGGLLSHVQPSIALAIFVFLQYVAANRYEVSHANIWRLQGYL